MIVDLKEKKSRPFVNDHVAGIASVSVSKNRLITASSSKDPFLRCWDRKANKALDAIRIPAEPREDDTVRIISHFAAAAFPEDDRVAIEVGDRIKVLNLSDPTKPVTLEIPDLEGLLTEPLVVSPDGSKVACAAVSGEVVVWDVKSKKIIFQESIVRESEDRDQHDQISGICFGKDDTIYACRSGLNTEEVSEGKKENEVQASRRGIVRIDLNRRKVTPLPFGHNEGTFCCAVDPTGTWLATGGLSRVDKPDPNGIQRYGEIRVYHLSSGELAYREQIKDDPQCWIAFTPNGKRLISAQSTGKLTWWDFLPE
jgi:WD40 repeat protein